MVGGHTVFLFYTSPTVHGAPMKHLIGFEKVSLEPNSAENVAFSVDVCKDMSLVDEVGKRKVALGSHVLHVSDLKHYLKLEASRGWTCPEFLIRELPN
ncbi:Beta-D-xylosidase 4 [Platanthera guangdongensis]|uniref:Beta-D-xylosidase 4 n=1 Tax=Platanthera guangdongensis TaxID=2320717 RepID=A0ABR2N3T6_9ASPA